MGSRGVSRYSTYFLASVLPTHGQIDTLEVSARHAEIANAFFVDADLYPFPKVHVGPALQTLRDPEGSFARLPGTDEGLRVDERGYDLVFVDADKERVDAYFLEALRVTRKGGVILVDNAVRGGRCVGCRGKLNGGGRIATEENDGPGIDVSGLRRMYDWVERDKGRSVTMTGIQTVGSKVWE